MAPQTAPEMMTVAKRPVIVYRFQRGQAAMPFGEGVVVGCRGGAGEGWCGWRTGGASLGVGLCGLLMAGFLVGGGGDGGAMVGGGCPSSPPCCLVPVPPPEGVGLSLSVSRRFGRGVGAASSVSAEWCRGGRVGVAPAFAATCCSVFRQTRGGGSASGRAAPKLRVGVRGFCPACSLLQGVAGTGWMSRCRWFVVEVGVVSCCLCRGSLTSSSQGCRRRRVRRQLKIFVGPGRQTVRTGVVSLPPRMPDREPVCFGSGGCQGEPQGRP